MTELELNAAGNDDAEIKRVPSYVPGLDTILCGGFLSGGVYLIQGLAGAGKTVLASQIIYSHAAQGERALYVTVLGENHGRMMAHLRPMRFFDESLVPDRVTYISAYQALDEDEGGLKGLTALLRGEVQARGPMLLVLDGLSAVEARAGSRFEMKRFTHELQALALATDCTMFVLNSPSGAASMPEHTLVAMDRVEARHIARNPLDLGVIVAGGVRLSAPTFRAAPICGQQRARCWWLIGRSED